MAHMAIAGCRCLRGVSAVQLLEQVTQSIFDRALYLWQLVTTVIRQAQKLALLASPGLRGL